MFGVETLGEPAHSVALVGLVFLEALALYVGYGALTALLGPVVQRTLAGGE